MTGREDTTVHGLLDSFTANIELPYCYGTRMLVTIITEP